MTLWLAVIFALLAVIFRKRLGAVLHWHPVAMLANAILVALVAGWIALALWLLEAWGLWGAAILACLTGLCVVVLRLYTGRWFWQDDDVLTGL